MFKKVKETDYGDLGEFWKPVAITIHTKTKSCDVVMAWYKNKGAYQAGKQALQTKVISLTGNDFPFSNGALSDILESVKLKIKATQEFFSDAGFEE